MKPKLPAGFKRLFLTPSQRFKKLFLLFVSCLLAAIFFMLPPNRDWAYQRIFAYYVEFFHQKNQMVLGQRMKARFENDYTFSKKVAHFFEARHNKNTALVLLPPEAYFSQYAITYHVPEPAVFYYYTGLKTLWPNCSNALQANWYVHVKNGEIVCDSVTNKQAFADTLDSFKKF